MMAALKRLLWLDRVKPITHSDVEPAEPEPMQAREVRDAQVHLLTQVMAVERASWQIRQELAGNALDIVSGERQQHG